MKRVLWAVPLLVLACAWFARGSYSYYYVENGASPTWSNWLRQNRPGYSGQLKAVLGGYSGIAYVPDDPDDYNSYSDVGRMTYLNSTTCSGEVKLNYSMINPPN